MKSEDVGQSNQTGRIYGTNCLVRHRDLPLVECKEKKGRRDSIFTPMDTAECIELVVNVKRGL